MSRFYSQSALNTIGDKYKYDMVEEICESCEKPKLTRKYKGENFTDPEHADCKKKEESTSHDETDEKLKAKL